MECILYMYLASFRGSWVGICHCEISWDGVELALPCDALPSMVIVKSSGCLCERSTRTESRSESVSQAKSLIIR